MGIKQTRWDDDDQGSREDSQVLFFLYSRTSAARRRALERNKKTACYNDKRYKKDRKRNKNIFSPFIT